MEGNPTAESAKEASEGKLKTWFAFAPDIVGDLAKAFRLFDAIHAAVKGAGSEVSEEVKKEWADCETWLKTRR
jgi:Temperature dependent protein affecting M2 dsRNA replication